MLTYLLYTGLGSSKPFILKIEEPLTTAPYFAGEVVACHKKSPWYVGYWCKTFANPVYDLMHGCKQDFVIISHDDKAKLEAKWNA